MSFLEISNPQLNDRLLKIAYQVEANVWKEPRPYPHYTHHDRKESEDICQIIQGISGTLPPHQALADSEKFILSAASILCNIGMQYPDLPSSGKKSASLENGLREIRENHPELSYRMIKKDGRAEQEQIKFPNLGLIPEDPYIELIALLVKGHEGISLPEYQEETWPGLGNVRLDLLAALLQLASCLSFNDTRLIMYRIKKASVIEQIRLWKYIHYKGVLIKEKGKIIQPLFNVPDIYKSLLPELCIEIENSIRSIHNQVIHVLRKYELKLRLAEAQITLQPNVVYSMPNSIREYMTNTAFRYLEILDVDQHISVQSMNVQEHVSSMPPRLNDRLDNGRYEIIKVISTPGTSNSFVYLAIDHKLSSRKVIIKVPAFFYDNQIPVDELTELQNRYRREINILLQRPHPYVVKIYDLIHDQFMVQEHVEGKSFRQVIIEKEVLSVSQIIQLALEVCDSMIFLKNAIGMIHRDIKPEHLFIRTDGHLCLIDFGLARAALIGESTDWRTERPVGGTPLYMAPEQVVGREDERSDIFSLGVSLYEVLTHQFTYPRGAFSNEVYTQKYIPSPQNMKLLRPDVPDNLEACILRAVDAQPEKRFQTWGELSTALKSCQQMSVSKVSEIHTGSLRDQYEQMIIALLNEQGEQIGTAFLCHKFGANWVITCAHVIQVMNKKNLDEIKMVPFNSRLAPFLARIVWLAFPLDQDARNWSADDDICILKIDEELPWALPAVSFGKHIDHFPVENCWCFGYINSRRPRGAYIEHVRLNTKVARGFIEISQLRVDPLDAGIEPGASGAPLCNQEGELLGMIQSTINSKISYLIPVEIIENTLNKLNERMKS